MKQKKTKRTMTISKDAKELLKSIADEENCSISEVVEMAVKASYSSVQSNEQVTILLEAWIDDVGMRNFVEREVKTHMGVWQVGDPEGLIRMIMISLRQELRRNRRFNGRP